MSDDALVTINDSLWIPRAELTYRASRSGGPGGQHVNTSSTRMELVWDVGASPQPDGGAARADPHEAGEPHQRRGTLLLAASDHRSQHQNKEAVTERFAALLREALLVQRSARRRALPAAPAKRASARRSSGRRRRSCGAGRSRSEQKCVSAVVRE
jgi:ribosome-associated protein